MASDRPAGKTVLLVEDNDLEREGLAKVKFTTQGLAASRPAVSNTKPDGSDDPEGRQKNRRVEIVFGKTKK